MEPISHYLLTFLLNSVWQIPLIAIVAAVVCRLMRLGPASNRHAIWVATLLMTVLLPMASVRSGEQGAPWTLSVLYTGSMGVATAPAPASARPISAPSPAASVRAVPFGETTANVLAGAYLLFLLFRLSRFVLAWRRTVRIRQSAEPCRAPLLLEQVWTRCMHVFGVSGVRLLSSQGLSSPLMAGVRRSAIILPEALIAETSEDVLTTAVGHEMAHIARHDFLFNLLHELLYLPVSFHPAAWIIRRRIEQTREMACDEMVTGRLLDPRVYARSIMTIATSLTAAPGPGYTLGVFDGDILEERIRRLVGRPAAKLRNARLWLVSGLSALVLCAVFASGLALTARAQSGVQAEMKLAGAAYNADDFRTAVQHFENAVRLDPSNINAKLFLANALMRQFFTEGRPPDSPLTARAQQQYRGVLAQDSQNKLALRGMVAIALDTKKMSEGREWAMKLIAIDPQDKTAYYTVGVIDWSTVFPELQRAKEAIGVKRDVYRIPDASVRKRLRDQFLAQIEEGFRMLQIALQLDPNYSDAMAYMNLLDRLKSGIVDDPAESTDLISKGDDWVGKALAARRRQPQSPPPPTSLDVDGPPPGPADAQVIVAAPPPPPPPPPPGGRPVRTYVGPEGTGRP